MNCQEYRVVLDAIAPGLSAGEDAEIVQAREHAQSCAECSSWLESAERFDRWMAPAFRNAPVPEGLRERLLKVLEQGEASTPRETVRASRRSALIWISSVAAACLAIVAGWWSMTGTPDQPTALTLQGVQDQLDAQSASLGTLAAFDKSFTPALPPRWNGWVSGSARGVDLDGVGGHDAAVYRFATASYSGYLVVLPADQLSDPPSLTIPHVSNANYAARRVSWRSGDQVCICYLDADGPRMQEFLSELYPQSA